MQQKQESEAIRERKYVIEKCCCSSGRCERCLLLLPAGPLKHTKGQVAGVGTVEVELVERGTPTFPRRARSYGVSGSVLVRFSVDVEGNAIGAVIVESKPRRMFDRSAMRYMETLKFAPYLVDGEATQVNDVQMTVAYVLEEG